MSGDALLTRADIDANDATLGNVRLWDHRAAAADVRADPGDPHLLRLRLGPQRSVHDRRAVPADHAVGARAELRQPAEPQLDQRAADVHARLRRHAGAGESGHAGRPAGAVHQGSPAAVVGRPQDRRAEHLFRAAVERLRVRPDERARVPLPEGRGQRLHDVRRHGRRPGIELLPAAALQHPVPIVQGAVERRHHQREPRDVPPAAVGARRTDRTVPAIRPGPVPRHLERPPVLAAGRLHDERPLSLFRRRRRTASTTSATRSRRRWTPITARSRSI